MTAITTTFGTLLILLGLAGYLGSGAESPTALIPAFVGIVLIICAALTRLGHVMNLIFAHLAVLIGLVGGIGGLAMSIPKLASGAELARPLAIYLQLGMGLILVVYVIFCVRSFIAARKARHLSTAS
jgi:hypothetical protein